MITKLVAAGLSQVPWFGLVTLGLWVLHSLRRSQTQSIGARPSLPALYARAFDGWAIVLTTMFLAATSFWWMVVRDIGLPIDPTVVPLCKG